MVGALTPKGGGAPRISGSPYPGGPRRPRSEKRRTKTRIDQRAKSGETAEETLRRGVSLGPEEDLGFRHDGTQSQGEGQGASSPRGAEASTAGEARAAQTCSSRRVGQPMGSRAAGGVGPGPPGGAGGWVITGVYGGRLLWGHSGGRRKGDEAGGGRWGGSSPVVPNRDKVGGRVETAHSPSATPVQGACVPPGVQQGGEWRLFPPRAESAEDGGRRRRAVDSESPRGAGRPSRRRRVRGATQEVAGLSGGCEAAGPGGGAHQEGKVSKKEKGGGSEQRKKEEEKEEARPVQGKSILDGRHPARAAPKEPLALFGGTALDPSGKVRRRVLRRAQKFVHKKRSRKSSSSSSKDTTSSSSKTEEELEGMEGIFVEDSKVKMVAERFPSTMRKSLLSTAGEEEQEQSTKPIAVLYYRQVLAKKTAGAQSRELLNLATAIDLLLRGRAAHALDVLTQRLKAQESVSQGTQWSVAQRVEVPVAEHTSLLQRSELERAQKENYQDAKTRWGAMSQSSGKKGENKGKKSGKPEKGEWSKEDRRDEGRQGEGKGADKK